MALEEVRKLGDNVKHRGKLLAAISQSIEGRLIQQFIIIFITVQC